MNMPKHIICAALLAAAGVQATATSWGAYPACPPPVTVNNTQYVSVTATMTIFETIIYTNTVTQATTETTIQITTETTIQSTTETETVSTTETVVQLFTETETTPTTITETTPTTLTETTPTTVTETTPTTLTETTPTTVTETTPTTLTETTPTTQLITLTATEEIELYTSTTRLTSLRLCPTRITNPTFTVEVPMPTQWTWGCPPGWICKPLQENCDFELGTPDRNFYCAPNECVPAPAIPQPLPNWGDTIYSNSTPLNTPGLGVTALDSYFNMAPTDFGFGYEIFVVDKVFTITSTFIVPPAATALPPSPQNNYTGFRARQAQTDIPGPCYTWCNNPMLEVQALGKTPKLCQPDSAFLLSLSQCRACIDYHAADNLNEADTFVRIAPQFQQFLDYCAGYTTTTVNGQTTAIPTSDVSTEPTITLVPSTVTTDVVGTTISGLAPTPAETLTGSEVEQLTIIMPRNGTTTTLSSDDLQGATLVLPAIGASQTEIITTGSSTYTTEVPASQSSLGDQTSAVQPSESATPTQSGPAVSSASAGSAPKMTGGSSIIVFGIPFVVAVLRI